MEKPIDVDGNSEHIISFEDVISSGLLAQTAGTAKDAEDDSASDHSDDTEQLKDETTGQQPTVKTLFEGPQKCHCCINWVEELPDDQSPAIEQQEASKRHALLIRMKKSHDQERKSMVLDSIVIQSPYLKDFLGELFQGYEGITTTLKKLVFKAPFWPFFYEWQRFNDLIRQEQDPVRVSHARLLRKTLKSELKDTISVSQDFARNGVISFETLWTVFKPGTDVFTTDNGYDRIYRTVSSKYNDSWGASEFEVHVRYIDVDDKGFGYGSTDLTIDHFDGTRAVTSLKVLPIDSHPFADEIRANLGKRGEKFKGLQAHGHSYLAYEGIVNIVKRSGGTKKKIKSRVTIDPVSYWGVPQDDFISLSPLNDIKLKSSLDTSDPQHFSGPPSPRYSPPPFPPLPPPLPPSPRPVRSISRSPNHEKVDEWQIPDDLLYLCSPEVRGYCFKLKEWAIFYIDQVVDIKWSERAFESLVLPTDYKRLLLSFVESQMRNKDLFDDVIEGKGQGIVILLEGSPGVGKTLTAEALAEKVRKPLYALSVAELGDSADDIETNLNQIFDIAVKWDAVVLLDESDVFLEKRRADSLARNGIVATFLRVLEYYRGVLFLTTNRVEAMDSAFQSRIHLKIQYPNLDEQARSQIWKQFVEMSAQQNKIEPKQLEELARLELNGREIKNLVKTAQLLASHEEAALGMEHIQTVLRVTQQKFGEVPGRVVGAHASSLEG